MPRTDRQPPKPQEAIDFLKRKRIVETEKWDDLKWGEHAHAFTVAHSANAAILNDLHNILIEAMESGQSYQTTKGQIKELMRKKGWYGRADIDPQAVDQDGKPDAEKRKKAQNYINWRIRIIYEQNQLTAYSAGQTRKLWSVQHIYPYWQYKQRQRKNKRQSHAAWHNMILKADDPAWDVICPPNGWRCACYRSPLTQEQADAEWARGAKKTLPTPEEGAPQLDPAWAYNPAKEALAPNWKTYKGLRKAGALRGVMQNYRDEMAKVQMSHGAWQKYSRTVIEEKHGTTEIPVHMATLAQQVMDVMDFDPKLMASDKALRHGSRGRGEKKGDFNPERDLTIKEIGAMPRHLANPDAIYRDGGEWLFTYKLNRHHEARVVFRQNNRRPLQLVSFTKVPLGNTQSTKGEPKYKK